MSYIEYADKVRLRVPYSESLGWIEFTPALGMVGVSYKNDPEMFYEHFYCEAQDLHELTELIEEHQSGYKGYKIWKDRRRVDYEAQNLRLFEAFWRQLNDYEKLAMVEWAADKKWSSEWIQAKRSIKSKKFRHS